jgi:hypothetical protein
MSKSQNKQKERNNKNKGQINIIETKKTIQRNQGKKKKLVL